MVEPKNWSIKDDCNIYIFLILGCRIQGVLNLILVNAGPVECKVVESKVVESKRS